MYCRSLKYRRRKEVSVKILPKVDFIEMPVSCFSTKENNGTDPLARINEVHLIGGFLPKELSLVPENSVILKAYPGLVRIYSLQTTEEQIEFLTDFVLEFKRRNVARIALAKVVIQESWTPNETKYFSMLPEVIGTDWPTAKRVITALISINPVCLRFLPEWAFSLFYEHWLSEERVVETILHESCHFLHFKKWQEMFPGSNPVTFEHPHPEWLLSELAAPIVLREGLLIEKARFYQAHQEVMIGGKNAPQFFTDIYRSSESYEEFLRRAFEELKKHLHLFPRE